MAKLLVTDKDGTNPTPFLRGILTSSLQSLGLGFSEAYELATSVRQDLSDTDKIDRGRPIEPLTPEKKYTSM